MRVSFTPHQLNEIEKALNRAFFLPIENVAMARKFDKPHTGHKDLLNLLKARGLLIADDALVYRSLARIGYYRLTGYFLPFQVGRGKNPHQFLEGVRFEDILQLYALDTELRRLVLDTLEKLEVALRTSICEYMCSRHGPHWYLDHKAFEVGKHQAIFEKAAGHVDYDFKNGRPFKQKEPEKKSRPLFLDHYYDNYDDPPLPAAWMLREIASFGFWAQVYDALVVGDRKQITQYWRHPNTQRIHEKLLLSWLWSISILRNRCAHHNRITHRHFAFPPKLPDKNPSKDLFYSKTDDLRTLLVIIFVLINCADPGYDFQGKLLALFNQYGQTVNIEKATGFSLEGKAYWHDTGFWIHPADAK